MLLEVQIKISHYTQSDNIILARQFVVVISELLSPVFLMYAYNVSGIFPNGWWARLFYFQTVHSNESYWLLHTHAQYEIPDGTESVTRILYTNEGKEQFHVRWYVGTIHQPRLFEDRLTKARLIKHPEFGTKHSKVRKALEFV